MKPIFLRQVRSDEYLDSTRKTIYEFTNGRKLTKEDQWKSTVGKKQPITKRAWKGRTIFKILPGGLENRTSVKVRPLPQVQGDEVDRMK